MGKNTTRIEATVMKMTAEGLEKLSNETGLSIGEVIDRLTMNMRADNKDLAVSIAYQEVIMLLSRLPQEENSAAFIIRGLAMGKNLSYYAYPSNEESRILGMNSARAIKKQAFKLM